MTSPTPEELDGIEARAKAADQAEWTVYSDDLRGGRFHCVGGLDIDLHEEDNGEANAAHIAGLDPPTALRLVSYIRERDRLVHDLTQERDRLVEALTKARGQVVAFMLDSHTPEQALANVADHDRVLAEAKGQPT